MKKNLTLTAARIAVAAIAAVTFSRQPETPPVVPPVTPVAPSSMPDTGTTVPAPLCFTSS